MPRRGKGPRQKHVPQRTCIACRQAGGKRALVRLVRTEGGVEVDVSGKLPGRGAYLHPSQECWSLALESNGIQKALRTKLSDHERWTLEEYMRSLPHTRVEVPDTDTVVAEDTGKITSENKQA